MGNFVDQIRLTGLALKPNLDDYDNLSSKHNTQQHAEVREPEFAYCASTSANFNHHVSSLAYQQTQGTERQIASARHLQSTSRLAQRLSQPTTIYLDTTYWVLIRDAFLGKSADIHLNTLSQQLIQLTSQRAVLFPLSIDTLLAVIQDTEESAIPATLDLLQSLSQGVCLLPFVTRAAREVECYLATQLLHADQKQLQNPPTPAAYMDFITWFTELEQERLTKHSSELHHSTYRETLSDFFANPESRQSNLALLKRFSTPSDNIEFKTFPKLDAYRQELAHSLQFLQPYIIQQLKRSEWLMVAGSTEQQEMAYRVLMSFLYDHWNQPTQREQFLRSSPSLYVNVLTLAAAYCGDNTDLLPHFIHAQAAIGHCDYYFSRLSVEQALCWLPDQSISHHLMSDFNCHFSCDTSEILGLLQQLYDKQQRCFL